MSEWIGRLRLESGKGAKSISGRRRDRIEKNMETGRTSLTSFADIFFMGAADSTAVDELAKQRRRAATETV